MNSIWLLILSSVMVIGYSASQESPEVTAIMSSLLAELKEEHRKNLFKMKTEILAEIHQTLDLNFSQIRNESEKAAKPKKRVYFTVNEIGNPNVYDGIITYKVTMANAGGGMHLESGKFTAPVSGIYHFHLGAVKTDSNAATYIKMFWNDIIVSFSYCSTGITSQFCSCSVTGWLGKGQTVYGKMNGNYLYHAEFTGFLLDEDVS